MKKLLTILIICGMVSGCQMSTDKQLGIMSGVCSDTGG
jgi:ribose 5-phosphate isomerase RpiB